MCVVSRSTAIASPATPLKTLPPTTILVFPMSQNFLGWLPSSRFLRRCVRRGEKKKTIKGRFGETALPFSFPPPSFIHPIFSPFAFYFPPSFPSFPRLPLPLSIYLYLFLCPSDQVQRVSSLQRNLEDIRRVRALSTTCGAKLLIRQLTKNVRKGEASGVGEQKRESRWKWWQQQ